MARTTLFTDNFNRTAEDPIGSPWESYAGVDGLRLISSAAFAKAVNAAVENLQSHNGSLPNNQWCEASIGNAHAGFFGALGLCFAAPHTVSGYLVFVAAAGMSFGKYTSGTFGAPSGGNLNRRELAPLSGVF